MLQPSVFFDKDGTLIRNVPYNVDRARIEPMPRAAEALGLLYAAGYRLVVVSNQSGIARGLFAIEELGAVSRALTALAASGGACFSGFYYCPHHPQGAVEAYSTRCRCRKPAPGMLFDAAEELHLDLERSWLVGDILNDVEAGSRAGCRTVLVDCGNETEWIPGPGRRPDYIASDILEAAQFIARSDGYIR